MTVLVVLALASPGLILIAAGGFSAPLKDVNR